MAWNTSNALGRLTAMLALVAACLVTRGESVIAQADAAASDAGIVGAWLVQVTLRNCTTGDPLGPPFNSLVTFHRGGTISESPGSLAFAPGQRSPGHGAWAHRDGHTYSQEMVALILFDSAPNLPGTPGFDPTKPVTPGFFGGWQTVSHTARLVDADHFTSSGTNAFYKTNGDLYRTGCSSAAGQRFQ